MQARLKSGLWVKALIRRCDLAAIGVAVTARGDADAGAILIKLLARDGASAVLAQARGDGGELVWMCATGAEPVVEADADSYIARQRQRDPDLWVVEIDSPAADPRTAARALIDEPIV